MGYILVDGLFAVAVVLVFFAFVPMSCSVLCLVLAYKKFETYDVVFGCIVTGFGVLAASLFFALTGTSAVRRAVGTSMGWNICICVSFAVVTVGLAVMFGAYVLAFHH